MKKVVRLTESQLVSVISEAISEGNVNEQLGGLLKRFIKPAVKGLESTRAGNMKVASSLLHSFEVAGVAKMSNLVKKYLEPFSAEIAVINNDLKRLQPHIGPGKTSTFQQYGKTYQRYDDAFGYAKKSFNDVLARINVAEGQKIDFGMIHNQINDFKRSLGELAKSGQVKGTGKTYLVDMQKNIDEALQNLETAVNRIALKR